MSMKTAIVILNYNGVELLQQFLPKLILHSQHKDAEIIVADNNSNDDSIAFISLNYPNIRTIRLDKNYGFAEGYNRALSQIEAEYYILLNSDVEVSEGWLSLIDFLDENPDICACQPKIKSWYHKDLFEHAGACGGFIDKYGYPFCRGRFFEHIEKDNGQYNSTIDVFWATGACFAIRAKDFKDFGGFDKTFFAHMEEIDLCWRLQLKGKRIACFPQSVVYHIGAKTLNKEHPLKTYLNFRNNLLMLYKNLPTKKLSWVLFIRFWLDYAAFFQNLLCGRISNANAIVRARYDYHKLKKSYVRNCVSNKITTIYPHSAIFDYYILKKRKFSDLKIKRG